MMKRVCVITAAWKRPEIYDVFARNMAALFPPPEVVCAGSPGDGCAELAAHYFHTYLSVPNVMGEKWNAACRAAQGVDAEYYLFMGSDDLLDQKCWDYYQGYSGAHLALKDYYFYNAQSKQTLYWPGYVGVRKGEPIGAGKLVSRAAMVAMEWKPFIDDRPNSLDYDMHHKLLGLGVKIDVVRLAETGGISLDIKSIDSVTPWKRIMKEPGMRIVSLRSLSEQLWHYTSTLRR